MVAAFILVVAVVVAAVVVVVVNVFEDGVLIIVLRLGTSSVDSNKKIQ